MFSRENNILCVSLTAIVSFYELFFLYNLGYTQARQTQFVH